MLLAFGLGLGSSQALAPTRAADTPANSASATRGENLSQGLARLLETLKAIRAKPNAPDELKLMRGAIQGMLKSLDDPYTNYLDPQDFQALKTEESGHVAGVGVELDYRNQEVVVMSVLDLTPAAKAGLHSGDKILAFDGVEARGLSWPEILNRLQGEAGQPLTLKILPAGQAIPRTLTLVRQELNLQAVEFTALPNDVCQLRIRTFFNENLHQEVETKLGEGLDACAGGLILDLRNNPGGLITEAIAVAGQLGIQGTVVQIVSREGQIQPEDAQDEALLPDTLPMVVLINKGTASAAEVLAAALKEKGRAVLMGETSFGKGLVQTLLPLSDGSGLLITTHRYLTSRGNNLHKVGIAPDIVPHNLNLAAQEAQDYLKSAPVPDPSLDFLTPAQP